MTDRQLDERSLDDLLGYHLRRLSLKVMTDLSAGLTPLGLSAKEASILLLIDANPGATQSDVGRSLGIVRANMAPLIGDLTARGMVERESIDGRSQGLSLTASGGAACRRAKAAIRAHEQRMFGCLPPEVRRQLIEHVRDLWQQQEPHSVASNAN